MSKIGWAVLPFVREEIIQRQIYLQPEFEELRRKIEFSSSEEKLELLTNALQHDEAGINYLITKIYGFQLEVGKKAYEILLNEFESNDYNNISF
jgi:hypothetical protein